MLDKDQLTSLLHNFFNDLSKDDIDMLLQICEFKTYPGKTVILKSGDTKRRAFLILEGTARGYIIDKKGEEKNILLRSKGIFVGDAEALFGNQPQKLTIESIDRTTVLLFSMVDFEALSEQNKAILNLYISSLKEAILRLTYRVGSLITMSPEERYIDLLEKNPNFLKDAFDKHIANYLGITAVSFSRIKKRLKTAGINK